MKSVRTMMRWGSRRRGARGQSAVETMFMLPVLLIVFLGMYELFTITWGAQHAHIRAREYVLHDGYYTGDAPAGENQGQGANGSVFDRNSRNYVIASRDIWGVAGANARGWKGWAHDRGIPGVARGTSDKGAYIQANAYICSPIGCPGGR